MKGECQANDTIDSKTRATEATTIQRQSCRKFVDFILFAFFCQFKICLNAGTCSQKRTKNIDEMVHYYIFYSVLIFMLYLIAIFSAIFKSVSPVTILLSLNIKMPLEGT